MNVPELRPLGIGEVIDAAFKLYRNNAATFLKIVAIIVIPVQVISFFVLTSALPDFDRMIVDDSGRVRFPATHEDNVLAAGLVIQLLAILMTLLALGACIKAAGDVYLGRTPEVGDSLRFTRSRLGSLLWLGFLFTVLVGLGFLALVIPGIYLSVAWSVCVPVLLIENRRGRKALGRSNELVRGRWWPTLAVLLLGYVLLPAVFELIIGFGLGLLVAGVDDVLAQLVLQTVIGTIASLLVTPFTVILLAILYFDLRVRKEAFDLQLLAERIEAGPELRPPAGG